ncbi:class F sortase [Solwaraspora sp. WMMD1047]|uniref:class F sortase n=1 Tax=Solwaraspora sp. WMMD1047 TaxID=3016102 RepID=UPI002418042C|nr:class F sortase [Solwaraspora sp. WMMD1047]MDG4832211.1 class F sortase [Solwaraspora sp. WMMD1047]
MAAGAAGAAADGGLTRRGLLTGAGLVVWAAAGTGLAVAATRPGAPAPVWLDPCAGDGCPSKAASTGRPEATAGRPEATAGPPTRIRITRIGVDSPLVVLGLERDGRLAAPADFDRAGWFGGGVAPGDTGPAVIAGHVDSRTGPAVFHRLPELRPGDRIEVRRDDRWLPFRVVAASRHAKDRFPTAAVYGPTPGPELRLVTCDGEFDGRSRHYRDNLVVFAVWDQPVDPFAKWTRPGPA